MASSSSAAGARPNPVNAALPPTPTNPPRKFDHVYEESPVAITALLHDLTVKPPPESPSAAALKHLEELHMQLDALRRGPPPEERANDIASALEHVEGLFEQVERLHEQAASWQEQLDTLLADAAVKAEADEAAAQAKAAAEAEEEAGAAAVRVTAATVDTTDFPDDALVTPNEIRLRNQLDAAEAVAVGARAEAASAKAEALAAGVRAEEATRAMLRA